MCEFCRNIKKTDKEYFDARVKGGDFILKDENGYGILIDTGDSGCLGFLQKIKFCPYCGKELNKVSENE